MGKIILVTYAGRSEQTQDTTEETSQILAEIDNLNWTTKLKPILEKLL